MADLNWYRSFIAVYRAGSVSRAALERNLTQPAVTQQIAALEAAVGESLFARTPKGMQPTERGKALYAQVIESLEKLERVTRGLKRSAKLERPLVRLGAPSEFFYEVALKKLVGLDVRLSVRFGETRTLLSLLENAELDGVIATQKLSGRGLEFTKIFEESFVLVGSRGLSMPADLEPHAWLGAQAWISYAPDLPIIRRFYRTHFERRPDFVPALIVPDLRAAVRALEIGQFVTVLPEYLCRTAIEAKRISLLWKPPTAPTNELWLAVRKADAERPELIELGRALIS